MTPLLDVPISKISDSLLLMASVAQRAFANAMKALDERDSALAEKVHEDEKAIDELEMQVDELIMKYMATRGPVATDCRFALVTTKICSNLERVGDEATTIARRARSLNDEPAVHPPGELQAMVESASKMLFDSITAFADRKRELAMQIMERDKVVDDLYRKTAGELTARMIADPSQIARCVNLLMVAKCVERIGDHAANIAEATIFLYSGQDIRHGHTADETPGEKNPS